MAQIEPFAGLRYTSADVSHVIAPPYDILNEADKAALLRKDDHNIVAIDLPHVPPKSAGPDEVYKRAAGELTSWLDIQSLARDPEPALYVYHQTYRLRGKTLKRKMFFARLRLEPFGQGKVFAHEQTFGGPKEDRLKLTLATRCNLSPIFGLYPDARHEVMAILDTATGRPPDQGGVLEGVQNELWVVQQPVLVEQVRQKMADKSIFIADGHHRYGTALMYRQAQVDETGEPIERDPINFVLAVLAGMEDPGATILPYFRTITEAPRATPEALQRALADRFEWTAAERPKDSAQLATILGAAGAGAIGLYWGAERGGCAIVRPQSADLLADYEPQRRPAWRKHPYSVLHRYIIDEVLTKDLGRGTAPAIHYHKTMADAIKDADAAKGIACLMPATTMDELREICTAGELMPQKSTYFFPKLATGMVINPLY